MASTQTALQTNKDRLKEALKNKSAAARLMKPAITTTYYKGKEQLRASLKQLEAWRKSQASSVVVQNTSDAAQEEKNESVVEKYAYLKNNSDWEEKSGISALESKALNGYAEWQLNKAGYKTLKKRIEELGEEEQKIYNYLNQTDEEKASEFLREIESAKNKKQAQESIEHAKKLAEESPVAASISSVGLNLVSSFGVIDSLFRKMTGQDIDINTPFNAAARTANAIRETVSKDMGGVGSFIYNTAMSLADNAARAFAGPVGAGILAMSEAASHSIVRGKEMGLSDNRALLYGISVGALEGLTEKYSVDKLLDKTTLAKSLKGYIVKTMIAEGSEEAVSELGDKVAQQILAGDEAEWRKEYEMYKSQGYSDAEAFGLTVSNTLGDVGLAALSGAISGGVMSGGYAGKYHASQSFNDTQLGRDLTRGANISQEQLIDVARASDVKSINRTASKLERSSTSRSVAHNTGKLTRELFEEAYKRTHASDLDTSITEGLSEAFGEESPLKSDYKNSEFGQKTEALREAINLYESIQNSKNAFAASKGQSIYTVSGDEFTYKVGENGEKTEKVEIVGLEEIKNGVAQVKISDGSVVSAENLAIPEKTAKTYDSIGRYNTETAKAFINGLTSYKGSVEQYALSFRTAYSLGLESNGRSFSEMLNTIPKNQRTALINLPSVESAFVAGANYTQKANEDSEKMRKAREAKKSGSHGNKNVKANDGNEQKSYSDDIGKSSGSEGNFTISSEINMSKLDVSQRAFLKKARLLSKVLSGVNIRIEDKGFDKNGDARAKENGEYNPLTNTIILYLTAGKTNEKGMFEYALSQALSHETVHDIKVKSPSDYIALKTFLQNNVYSDIKWNQLVRGRLVQYRNALLKEGKNPEEFTYEDAEEEVVANACQNMFNSPRVLSALAKENLGLLGKIKLKIRDFFDRVIHRLGQHVNYTVEAREFMNNSKSVQRAFEKKFAEAIRNANKKTHTDVEKSKSLNSESTSIKYSFVDNDNEIKYNLNQENNSKNGENKNEQDNQDSRVLEGRALSASSGSGDNKRSQGYDTSKHDDVLEGVATSRKRMATESGRKRKTGTWLSKSGIRTKEDWIRFRKTLLRNWSGRIADTDASGRKLTADIKDKFKDSIFKNENGELLSLYHWTASEFTDFAYGDVGFHFGTEKAAEDRRSIKPKSKLGSDITKEVYLNINSPILMEDSGAYWDAKEISYQLWLDLKISDEEYFRISHLHGAFDGEYNDEASIAVRNLLKDLGYDGIIYSNAVEDRGSLSVIALYPDQIYTVAENGVDLNSGSGSNTVKYSLAEATATKNTAESTRVESAAKGRNYLVRDNSPNEFNPEGKSLKGQLEEALDSSQSKEQRYIYAGEFTQEFIDKLKDHIDIKNHPVVMNYRDAYLSMESKENGKYQGSNINYHNLGIDGLESAINSICDPEYVILSTKNNKIELILEGRDYKGRQLFSIVEINTKTLNNNKFMDAHVVTTVYGHRGIDNRIVTAKNDNRLIYNKNESAQGITSVQYQRNINANSLSGDSVITTTSISDFSEKINSFDKNSSENVAEKLGVEGNLEQRSKSLKYSRSEDDEITTREILAGAIERVAVSNKEIRKIERYRKTLSEVDELLDERIRLTRKLDSLKDNPKASSERSELRAKIKNLKEIIARKDKLLVELQNTRPLREAMVRYALSKVEESHLSDEMYYYRKMAELKRRQTEEKEKLKAQIEKYKQENKKRETELKSDHSEKLKQTKKQYRDKAQIKQLKEKIQKLYSKYIKMLEKPDDNHYVPRYLIEPLAKTLELLDFDTQYFEKTGRGEKIKIKRAQVREALMNLARQYEKLKKDEDSDYQQEYDEEIREYFVYLSEAIVSSGTDKVSEMDIETLSEIAEILTALDETLRDAKKMIAYEYAVKIKDVVDTLYEEQAKYLSLRKRKADAEVTWLTRAIRQWNNNSLTPMQVVEELSEHNETAQLKLLFNEFAKGKSKSDKFYMEAHKMFEELVTGKNRKNFLNSQSKLIDLGIKDSRGQSVMLTKQLIMQILLTVERERANENINHIFSPYGGINIPNAKQLAKGKYSEAKQFMRRVKPSEDMLLKLEQSLDEWDLKYMDAARYFFNVLGKNTVNEVSRQLKHRDIATSPCYIPIEVDKKHINREIGENDGILQELISSYGFMKSTSPGAQQPINIMGLDIVIEQHIDRVSKLAGYAIPIRNFNKVWNSSVKTDSEIITVKAFMQENFGLSAVNTITQAIKDLQGERINAALDTTIGKLIHEAENNFVISTMTLNLSSVLKQLSSLPNGFAILNNRNLFHAYGSWIWTAGHYENIIAEIDEHTPAHYIRRQGLSTKEVGDFATKMTSSSRLLEKIGVGKLNLKSIANLIKVVDCVTAATFWNYAKQDVSKSRKYKEGTQEYWDAVVQLYERTLNETQSTYDVLNRPELLKSQNQLTRALTFFTTETFKQAGMLRNSIGKYVSARRSGDIKRISAAGRELRKTLWALVRASLMLVLFTTLGRVIYRRFDSYKDEEGNIAAEKVVQSAGVLMLENYAGLIAPVLGNGLVDVVEGMASGNYYWSSEAFDVPSFDFLNDWIRAFSSLSTGIDVEKLWRAASSTIEVFTGFPAQNLGDLVKAIKEWWHAR